MVLVVVLAFGTCTSALGIGLNDDAAFVKQSTRRDCTLASATMLLRRKAILDGDANWSSITNASVGRVAWGGGLAWNFTYNGVSVTVQRRASGWGGSSLEEKKAYLISMLEAHPEGIVTYNYSHPHAVLLTSYDAETDTFYCSDPAACCPTGVIPLSSCIMDGSGQDGKLKHIDQLWYAASGVSSGAGTMPTPEEEAQAALEAQAAQEAQEVQEPERSEDAVAWISTQEIEIDGVAATFQTYVVVDDAANETCFVNVRDIAAALSGTAGQFDVALGEETTLFTGVAYPYGGCGAWESFPPIVSAAPVDVVTRVDGEARDVDAIQVADYNGESHVYYKLRDLGDALGFQVNWDAQRGTYIETGC